MVKHRGFPGRLPGTDFQFVIRRANPKGVTADHPRERYADRRPADRAADCGLSGRAVGRISATSPSCAATSMPAG